MIAKLMQDNYKDILKAAKLITRRSGKSPHELINESYLKLADKKIPTTNKEFVKFFGKDMYFMNLSPRSSFNKANKIGIEVKFEPTNNEYEDIINNLDIKKEIDIESFYNSLAPHHKEMYDLHFVEGKSCREIAKSMAEMHGYFEGGSYVRYAEFANEIKQKLKEWK